MSTKSSFAESGLHMLYIQNQDKSHKRSGSHGAPTEEKWNSREEMKYNRYLEAQVRNDSVIGHLKTKSNIPFVEWCFIGPDILVVIGNSASSCKFKYGWLLAG